MIISCINCYKKFEINSDLIPENGRLLQCSICNHQWFFKKKLPLENINQNETDDKPIINDILTDKKIESETNLNPIQKKTSEDQNIENLSKDLDEKENTIPIDTTIQNNKKSIHFFNILLVFVLSFVALIILIDTFKFQIAKIFPNIEFVLYNLYESIKDIILFFKDLI